MRRRLLLGPVMIAVLLLGLWLDERLDAMATPESLRPWLRDTWPPGTVIFTFVAALACLAAGELAAMLRDKGILASRRICTTARRTPSW